MRREQLKQLFHIARENLQPFIVAGDFNTILRSKTAFMATRRQTGEPKSNIKMIRESMAELQLADPFVEDGLAQEFTYEKRSKHGKQYSFRSDFLVCSRSLLPSVTYGYDHETRIGGAPFTDHSAIVAEITIVCRIVRIPAQGECHQTQFQHTKSKRVGALQLFYLIKVEGLRIKGSRGA